MLRERVLDATVRLILAKGTDAVRLEDVASEAGVSKGGLLHHFRSKQALIEGVLRRQIAIFEAVLPPSNSPPGSFTKAWLDAAIPLTEPRRGDPSDQVAVALLCAISGGSETLDVLREHYEQWQERLVTDGLEPATATLVRFAVDGWWTSRILGLAPPTGELYQRLRQDIADLVEPA
ncbi:TetR/AcrR family transcriptional regulator [Actinocrispum wychmicini]|uniref:TetR family transcriptional regulator n=1 Tax=Actinocrispum wychmicini TaxID=1213861 RepID=A0A4R2JTD9_9PSEU|nr:TetR/AcrR family transcriptional regulator [Actinocrispum wychmicini]TCO62242.1 TetR family transcriptional regulator [Actinocrispum wychmicini]